MPKRLSDVSICSSDLHHALVVYVAHPFRQTRSQASLKFTVIVILGTMTNIFHKSIIIPITLYANRSLRSDGVTFAPRGVSLSTCRAWATHCASERRCRTWPSVRTHRWRDCATSVVSAHVHARTCTCLHAHVLSCVVSQQLFIELHKTSVLFSKLCFCLISPESLNGTSVASKWPLSDLPMASQWLLNGLLVVSQWPLSGLYLAPQWPSSGHPVTFQWLPSILPVAPQWLLTNVTILTRLFSNNIYCFSLFHCYTVELDSMRIQVFQKLLLLQIRTWTWSTSLQFP